MNLLIKDCQVQRLILAAGKKLNDSELNDLEYKDAIIKDKRKWGN